MRRNRFLPALIVAIGLLVAGIILAQERHALKQSRARVRQAHRLHLRSCAEHVHDYFDATYSLLLFVSVDESVVALRRNSQPYIEKLFQHGLEQNQLTEVYIVERSFDGKHRPFMTFERGSEGMEAGEVHAPAREQEEYNIQREQLRTFQENPTVRALLSPEIRLCAPGKSGSQSLGYVYSVPIRSGTNLVGLVAGMLRTKTIVDVLRRGGGECVPALVSEHGQVIVEDKAPAAIRQWLTTLAASGHITPYEEDVAEAQPSGGWVALSTQARLESGEKWWLAYFYPEAQEKQSAAMLGLVGHLGLAASVLLAAGALASLVRSLDRRVSEQALYLRQRKELERQVQEASDREKRRAGEALREDFCQRLAGVEALAKVLEKSMRAAGSPQSEIASEVSGALKDTLTSARQTADELQPFSLLRHGFLAAMEKLAETIKSRKGISCLVEAQQFPDSLDPDLATHLYRIAQEALNNVVQHAKATAITIKLSAAGGSVQVEVTDNGGGFAPQSSSIHGMGLRIMRYRSELIGAELKITSTRGQGTLVKCSCPLEAVHRNAQRAEASAG